MVPGSNQRPASNCWEHAKSLLSLLPNCGTQTDDFSSPLTVSSAFYIFLHSSQLVSKSTSFALQLKQDLGSTQAAQSHLNLGSAAAGKKGGLC